MTGICIIINDEAKYAQQRSYLIQCARRVFEITVIMYTQRQLKHWKAE